MPLKWVVTKTFISHLPPFKNVIKHALQSTTLTCLVDDPVLTSTLSRVSSSSAKWIASGLSEEWPQHTQRQCAYKHQLSRMGEVIKRVSKH